MGRKLILPILLIAQLSSSGFAQQPSPTPPPVPQTTQKPDEDDVVRITTNLVQVDAVITDNHGKVVTDLKPEEVEIMEDGRKQKITHFSFTPTEVLSPNVAAKPTIVDKSAPPVPPSKLRPEDVRRTIALVVDDLGLSFESTYYVRRALKKFVDEQMQAGDLVAIVRTSGGMGALQSFTTDKRQLSAAIERVKWSPNGRGGVSAFAPMTPPTPGEMGAEVDAAVEEQNRFRDDVFAVGTLGAIDYVVRGLKELPGRKSILLISDGLRLYHIDNNVSPEARTGSHSRSYNYEETLALDRLRRLIDQANRASVVIYTMNATGLQTLGLTAADSTSGRNSDSVADELNKRRDTAWENQDGLSYIARETGGIAIHDTNDLAKGMRRVLEDQRGYYLIGYRPDSFTFDPRTGRRTFHKLSLKVTRPGKFNVRMRNGFFGVTDDEKPAPQTLAMKLYQAAASPFASTGVHLQLTSLFANDEKVGSFMRSVVHINAGDLTFTEEPNNIHQCVFDVLSMTFGDNGIVVEQTGRTYTLRLPEETYKRVNRDGLVYYLTVPVKKPGAYQLRMSLRDTATERIGSASQFIDVPDVKKNRLALSGLILRGYPSRTPQANNESPSADQEGIDKGSAEASPAVRRFHSGMYLNYAFFIYDAHSDKGAAPQLSTQIILFHDGKPVFTGRPNPMKLTGQTDLKRLLGGGILQLGTDLEPGDYVLQVIVTDELADKKHQTAAQWMDFSIVK